jgi:hypothetical protein
MAIARVSDEHLSRLEERQGPTGVAAAVLRELARKRARDYQAFAWRIGAYYFVGPVPDARTEVAMLAMLGAYRGRGSAGAAVK